MKMQKIQTISTQNSDPLIENDPEIIDQQKQITDLFYKPHPMRFFYFFVFALQNLFYGFLLTTYYVLYQQLKIAYNYEYYQVQECLILVLIGKVSVILFVTNILQKFGIKKVNIFAILILVFCCFLRLQISKSFSYVLLSMVITGISGVFLTSQHIKFCYNWFPISERLIYMSILQLTMPLGISIGMLYPLLILDSDEENSDIIKQKIDQIDFQYMLMSLIILFFTLFMKEKPPSNYGWQSEEGKKQTQNHPNQSKSIFWRIKNLIKVSQFRIYVALISLKMNIMMISSSVNVMILQDLGYPHWLPGFLSITICFVSIIGSLIYIKFFLNQKQKFYFTLFSLISMIFSNMKILSLIMKKNCFYYSIFDILENTFSGALHGVLFELITRNITIDDFNFTNAVLVFISFSITLIGQQLANFILRFLPDIDSSAFVIFTLSSVLYYIYFYFCFLLKQLIFIQIKIKKRNYI